MYFFAAESEKAEWTRGSGQYTVKGKSDINIAKGGDFDDTSLLQ